MRKCSEYVGLSSMTYLLGVSMTDSFLALSPIYMLLLLLLLLLLLQLPLLQEQRLQQLLVTILQTNTVNCFRVWHVRMKELFPSKCTLWNSLPGSTKPAKSRHSFKCMLKTHVFALESLIMMIDSFLLCYFSWEILFTSGTFRVALTKLKCSEHICGIALYKRLLCCYYVNSCCGAFSPMQKQGFKWSVLLHILRCGQRERSLELLLAPRPDLYLHRNAHCSCSINYSVKPMSGDIGK